MEHINTKLLYLQDKYLHHCEATVLSSGNDKSGKYIVVDRTVAFPKGGGQKASKGTVDGLNLLDVQKIISENGNKEVRHYLEDLPSIGTVVDITIDQDFLHRSSVLHSAGHLIADVLVELYNTQFKAINAQHYDGDSWIRGKWNGKELPCDLVEHLQCRVTEWVNMKTPIRVSLKANGFRTVKIAGGTTPCGGTHSNHTGELSGTMILSAKLKKGTLRVRYDCI